MGRARADRVTQSGKRRYTGRVYVPEKLRHLNDGRAYAWVGTFATAQERDRAKASKLEQLEREDREPAKLTVSEYVDLYVRRFEKRNKSSSAGVVLREIKPFVRAFGHRELGSITRHEAEVWADSAKRRWVVRAAAVMNAALLSELVPRNVFKGLAPPERTRKDDDPPTDAELASILEACAVHGTFADEVRAVVRFACFTALRPCELCALRWEHIDLENNRLRVVERVYNGVTDRPKSGRDDDVIALIPEAREVLAGLRKFSDGLVFHNKIGKQLHQQRLSVYWNQALEGAGLEFDFYLATRHYCAHYMWRRLGLPREVVRVQLRHVDEKLLERVYGHADVGALAQIDAAARASVHPLRPVELVSEREAV